MKNKEEKSFDKIKFYRVEDSYCEQKIADEMLMGFPVCLDLRDCPREDAKEVLFFLSGVIYALDGNPERIKTDIFLFARKSDYRDGSLKDFIGKYK